ncbi:MAG: SUMF1/EgtB/PvdO family nonheme iron enzyme, partial [Gallionellaceae bacterium]
YGTGDFVFIPSLEQKVADSQAEIAKLKAEEKVWNEAQAAAKLAGNQAEIDRLKREADIAKNAIAGKLKAEQLRQDELAAEAKRRAEEETERQKQLAAKDEADKELVKLKALADARRKHAPLEQAGKFPTLESAVAEIKRLNARINTIEAGYEKELTQTRAKVSQRYKAQLAALDKAKPDEFENPAEFKAKLARQRSELESQREAELGSLNVAELAAGETTPLRESIKQLAEREYTIGAESIFAELGTYNFETQRFPLALKSKTPNIKLAMNSNILLPPADAKAFKQQWAAGLVRPEGRARVGSDPAEIVLANDANNMRFTYLGGAFLTPKMVEQAMRPEMVKIPFDQPFYMAKTEVTQAQWHAVMGDNPSRFTGCDNCPVEQVSWDDIQIFLQKLNAKTGKQYRLPTEAEWEYACYGGTQTEYCGSEEIDSVAWYASRTVHPVGQKQANGYGLYDMSGNVWEWVQNEFNYRRVLRGGSWFSRYSGDLHATSRISDLPSQHLSNFGFRVARTLP